MNSRERVKTSVNHQSPDRIPLDIGSTGVTGIHVLAVEKLRNYYGLEKKPVRVIEPYQMLGEVEPDLREQLGIDVIGLNPQKNMFGIPNDGNLKELKTFWGQVVLVPAGFNTTYDEEGNLLIHPEGDTESPPSGKMPRASYFFDAIIRQDPLTEEKLDPMDNLEEFSEISEEDLNYWKKEIDRIRGTDRAVIANFGGTAIGDIALVPAMNLKHPKGIRDIAEWYMSIIMRPDYIHEIFSRQTDIAIKNLEKLFRVVKNDIDAVFICGTDFGTQDSQFCGVDTLEEMYLPYYKKMNDWIHAHTQWKTFKHSCGAVEPFIEKFIEAGFDILNPVQINAKGMDPVHLKNTYGDRITFWGGGVDTQKVLSFGTPAEIKKQVTENMRIFGQNGGFVFNTVHNIQANVPLENMVAMLDAIHEFNA
jgi:hypothetical protein